MTVFQHDTIRWADKRRVAKQHIKPTESSSTLAASEYKNTSTKTVQQTPYHPHVTNSSTTRFQSEHSLSTNMSEQEASTKPTGRSIDSTQNIQPQLPCGTDSHPPLIEVKPVTLRRNKPSIDPLPINDVHQSLDEMTTSSMQSDVRLHPEDREQDPQARYNQTTHESPSTSPGAFTGRPVDDGLMHVSGPYTFAENVPSHPEAVEPPGGLEVVHRKRLKPDTETRSMADLSFLSLTKSRQMFRRLLKPRDLPVDPLPENLEFCFSNCSEHIILWCKRHISEVVRISFPFHEGQKFRLRMPAPFSLIPNKEYVRSVRFLVASHSAIAAVIHIDKVSQYAVSPVIWRLNLFVRKLTIFRLDGYTTPMMANYSH
jgi:hypothetical protein